MKVLKKGLIMLARVTSFVIGVVIIIFGVANMMTFAEAIWVVVGVGVLFILAAINPQSMSAALGLH